MSVQDAVRDFICGIDGCISKAVGEHVPIPIWQFEGEYVTQEDQRHFANLEIPVLGGKPSLLLHNLGRFPRDPDLQKRLENIFMHNCHTFFFNTSGSGKTRLLLEGLCQNWGFYFTSCVDSSQPVGSIDVQQRIQDPGSYSPLPLPSSSNYNEALDNNRRIASTTFRRVLLARLIIFTLFLEKVNLCRDSDLPLNEYKKCWLLLQVVPKLGHPKGRDIFDELAVILSRASDSWVTSRSKFYMHRIRDLLAPEMQGTKGQTPLFCVLDEAQFAASQHKHAFRSNDKNDGDMPILMEIIHAWERQLRGKYVVMSMVVTATGISRKSVKSAITPALRKISMYREHTETGAFTTLEAQKLFLMQYLPTSLIQSGSGVRLLNRVGYWLRGRHQFTAGYVEELICNKFRQPHTLLRDYVRHITGGVTISDAVEYVENEGRQSETRTFSQGRLEFFELKKNSDLLATAHGVIIDNLLSSKGPRSIGRDDMLCIEHGFARVLDSKQQGVLIDEPLAVLAAVQWMNTNHQSAYKAVAKDIRRNTENNNGFEKFIAVALDLIFSKQRRLSEVFEFHGTKPSWADMNARLVSVFRDDTGKVEICGSSFCGPEFVAPSATLGIAALYEAKATLSWLQHHDRATFCFPHPWMKPDVLFVLEIEDGSRIWVALQSKWSKQRTIMKVNAINAMKSVTPSKYFSNKHGKPHSPVTEGDDTDIHDKISEHLLALPARRSDAGKYSLLRVVVSFPAPMGIYTSEDPDQDGHPFATLKMELVKEITRDLSPERILEAEEKNWRELCAASSRGSERKETRKRKRGQEQLEQIRSCTRKRTRI
ncbi:hypothetical protein AGABI2DRAFT_122906 [Agaricus bisporus var. bisporus H97]|uniref:hypothetical protein n=1 Tax=Agaricus bisporus var. bisporus (strain H97 / ATCC MYA-4626 / FGSC 10389) TaxID=936046 RepID=UPI00029F799F|nr:hypothetical protein AGABI2DRAFT_122906 [Agaricus bisporus var. bisporus H97]EKV42176.1 hypothetical protein AGABI2DRAFT_122906 [Agaricus bisporus var. bisporus H97]